MLGTAFTASAQSEKPTASDVGVTATEIRIGVVADDDNPFVPGIFQGSGRGARRGEVHQRQRRHRRSQDHRRLHRLEAQRQRARNAFIDACEQDFALVGTDGAVPVEQVDDQVNCKDSNGAGHRSARPRAAIATACPSLLAGTLPANAPQLLCDTKDQTRRPTRAPGRPTTTSSTTRRSRARRVPSARTTPGRQRSATRSTAIVARSRREGRPEVALSGRDPQSVYTPVVQGMKNDRLQLLDWRGRDQCDAAPGRKPQLQGIPDDQVTWGCPSPATTTSHGDAGATVTARTSRSRLHPVRGDQYNKSLADYVKYTGKDKVAGFGVSGGRRR